MNIDHNCIPRPIFSIDQVTLVTSTSTRSLNARLPIKELRYFCPEFRVLPLNKYNYKSKICFLALNLNFLETLVRSEELIGAYEISEIELAFDFPASDEREARAIHKYIYRNLYKKYHRRRQLSECSCNTPPPHSIIQGPTIYWEDRKSKTGLKAYCRYSKVTGKPAARLEWTLRGARDIKKKTGIDRIEDLIEFNSESFLERHFVIETINKDNYVKYLLKSKNAKMAFNLLARINAYQMPIADEDFELAIGLASSTSYIRGALLHEKACLKNRRGRRTPREKKIANLTQHQLRKIFNRIDLLSRWDY